MVITTYSLDSVENTVFNFLKSKLAYLKNAKDYLQQEMFLLEVDNDLLGYLYVDNHLFAGDPVYLVTKERLIYIMEDSVDLDRHLTRYFSSLSELEIILIMGSASKVVEESLPLNLKCYLYSNGHG